MLSPIWWLYARYLSDGRYGWSPFETPQLYELAVIAGLTTAWLWKRRDIDSKAAVLVIVIHFGFWFWLFGRSVYLFGYGGPLGPAVGLFASLAWVAHIRCDESTLSLPAGSLAN